MAQIQVAGTLPGVAERDALLLGSPPGTQPRAPPGLPTDLPAPAALPPVAASAPSIGARLPSARVTLRTLASPVRRPASPLSAAADSSRARVAPRVAPSGTFLTLDAIANDQPHSPVAAGEQVQGGGGSSSLASAAASSDGPSRGGMGAGDAALGPSQQLDATGAAGDAALPGPFVVVDELPAKSEPQPRTRLAHGGSSPVEASPVAARRPSSGEDDELDASLALRGSALLGLSEAEARVAPLVFFRSPVLWLVAGIVL